MKNPVRVLILLLMVYTLVLYYMLWKDGRKRMQEPAWGFHP